MAPASTDATILAAWLRRPGFASHSRCQKPYPHTPLIMTKRKYNMTPEGREAIRAGQRKIPHETKQRAGKAGYAEMIRRKITAILAQKEHP